MVDITNGNFVVKDSGDRREFDTGSRRDTDAGKPRYDLIPVEALRAWANLCAAGAIKYGERNWEKGQPMSVLYASLLRHVYAVQHDTSEDHLAAVLFNAGALVNHAVRIANGELPEELADSGWARRLVDTM